MVTKRDAVVIIFVVCVSLIQIDDSFTGEIFGNSHQTKSLGRRYKRKVQSVSCTSVVIIARWNNPLHVSYLSCYFAKMQLSINSVLSEEFYGAVGSSLFGKHIKHFEYRQAGNSYAKKDYKEVSSGNETVWSAYLTTRHSDLNIARGKLTTLCYFSLFFKLILLV